MHLPSATSAPAFPAPAGTIASLTTELEATQAAKESAARELASAHVRLEIAAQEAAAKVGGCHFHL